MGRGGTQGELDPTGSFVTADHFSFRTLKSASPGHRNTLESFHCVSIWTLSLDCRVAFYIET